MEIFPFGKMWITNSSGEFEFESLARFYHNTFPWESEGENQIRYIDIQICINKSSRYLDCVLRREASEINYMILYR
jgi:hypothetical protein